MVARSLQIVSGPGKGHNKNSENNDDVIYFYFLCFASAAGELAKCTQPVQRVSIVVPMERPTDEIRWPYWMLDHNMERYKVLKFLNYRYSSCSETSWE